MEGHSNPVAARQRHLPRRQPDLERDMHRNGNRYTCRWCLATEAYDAALPAVGYPSAPLKRLRAKAYEVALCRNCEPLLRRRRTELATMLQTHTGWTPLHHLVAQSLLLERIPSALLAPLAHLELETLDPSTREAAERLHADGWTGSWADLLRAVSRRAA